jgi:hypothetical protein
MGFARGDIGRGTERERPPPILDDFARRPGNRGGLDILTLPSFWARLLLENRKLDETKARTFAPVVVNSILNEEIARKLPISRRRHYGAKRIYSIAVSRIMSGAPPFRGAIQKFRRTVDCPPPKTFCAAEPCAHVAEVKSDNTIASDNHRRGWKYPGGLRAPCSQA